MECRQTSNRASLGTAVPTNFEGPRPGEATRAWQHRLVRAKYEAIPAVEVERWFAHPANVRLPLPRGQQDFRGLCSDLAAYVRADSSCAAPGSEQEKRNVRLKYLLSIFLFGGFEALAAHHDRTLAKTFAGTFEAFKQQQGGHAEIGRRYPSVARFLPYFEHLQRSGSFVQAQMADTREPVLQPKLSLEIYNLQLRPLMFAFSYRGIEGMAEMASLLLAGAQSSWRIISASPGRRVCRPAQPVRPAVPPAPRAAEQDELANSRAPSPELAAPASRLLPGGQPPGSQPMGLESVRSKDNFLDLTQDDEPEGSLVPIRARPSKRRRSLSFGSDLAAVPALPAFGRTTDSVSSRVLNDIKPATKISAPPVPSQLVPTPQDEPAWFHFERQGLTMALRVLDARKLFQPGPAGGDAAAEKLLAMWNKEPLSLSFLHARSLLDLDATEDATASATDPRHALRARGLTIERGGCNLLLLKEDWQIVLGAEEAARRATAPIGLMFSGYYMLSDALSLRLLVKPNP